MSLPSVWVADLVVALDNLDPQNDNALAVIADVLGFALRTSERAVAVPDVVGRQLPSSSSGSTHAKPLLSADSNAPGRSSSSPDQLPLITPRPSGGEQRPAVVPLRLGGVADATPPARMSLLSPLAGRFIAQESSAQRGQDSMSTWTS